MKTKQKLQDTLISEIKKYKKLDFAFSSGRILGSMCTQPHPISTETYMHFLDTNLGDPQLFPGTYKLEKQYINWLKTILHAPKNSTGIIGSGGTESNINAIWIAKNLFKKKELIVPESAHFSFQKIASLMDIKLVTISMDKNYCMDISKLKKKINNKTAAIVGIAGTTELGIIDPIQEISDICLDENIFFHVDAAFGGFIIPFLKELDYDLPCFDFKIKGVKSISIDAHKMGCSAIPMGILMVRDQNWIDNISVTTPYISTRSQAGLSATRSGGPVAGAYAVAKYLGKKGYTNIAQRCMKTTRYAEQRIKELGFNLVIEPILNVIAVEISNPSTFVNRLSQLGWKVNEMGRLSAIRIVLMPHITVDIIDDFIPCLEKVGKELGEI